MPYFRKRPVEVEAVQWTGDNEDELVAFAGSLFHAVGPEDRGDDPDQTAAIMDTLHNTWMRVYDGQWIVKGVKGEFYVIAPDVLAETYEPVGEEDRYRALREDVREIVTAHRGRQERSEGEEPEPIGYTVVTVFSNGVAFIPADTENLETRDEAVARQKHLTERIPPHDGSWVACKVVPLVDEQGQG